MPSVDNPFFRWIKRQNNVFIVAIAFLISNPLMFIAWENNNVDDISIPVSIDETDYDLYSMDDPQEVELINFNDELDQPMAFSLNLTNGSFTYPAGSTITPFGNSQTETGLRTAYKALFSRIYGSSDAEIVMAPFSYGGVEYPPGTIASMGGFGGSFNHTVSSEDFNITAGLALHPKRIAIFKSEQKDGYGQNITWEEGYFERIFRVYLWGDYFDTVDEKDIKKGELLDYDVLIMPSVTKDYEKKVVKKLGPGGLAKLRQFVRKGNMLYAQGGSGYIAEQARLIPNGTVLLDTRIEANNNRADMAAVNTSSIMTMNWLKDKMYMLDDPLLVATDPNAVVANYTGNITNSLYVGSPAIMEFGYKNGQVIITNGHPSVNNIFYPIVFNAMLTAMAEPPDIRATAHQIYDADVASDLIPAQEPDIPVEVEVTYLNFWPMPSNKKINLTETISPLFYLDTTNITPSPHSIWYNSLNETMVSWEFVDGQGMKTFKFIVRTFDNTTKKGVVHISSGVARYEPIGYKGKSEIYHPHVTIRAALAARLVGDRDIELDGCYPLPASGFYYDIALPLENKEETEARNISIVDIVVLKSPIVDVDNQTRVPDAWNNTNNGTSNIVFAMNDIFYYYDKHGNPMYPMPDEVINTTYNYTFGNNGTNITLPAKKLVWHYPNIIPYDYQEPAIRYGIFAHEEHDRTVSFLSSPVKGSVILNASGGSVFTNLGIHPVPYHEYLAHGVITIPVGEELPRVDYRDIWNRNHTMELRTVFYDIVPFPPPEEHAVVTTTFEMTHDGERLKEFPIHHEVELNFTIKSWNGYGLYNATSYPYNMDLHKNETMIVQAIPRGVGYNIDYTKAIFNENTTLIKIENTSTHTILYFQQFIAGGHKEVINVKANLTAYPEVHREGRMKINDGARFVYHQIAVGPSRYEVFDSHVQAVFAIGNDVTVKKKVAPVYIATFGDDVYHFVRLEDPYEPREFLEDPYIKSYGFGTMAATTYVGGRTNDTIHRSRVEPGDKTLIRLEVDNNLGHDLNNVTITPVAPPGFTVVPDTFTTEVPPIFYDFPFINRTDIWDAWKSVYYWWVYVDDSVIGGEVYQINFTFECDSTNASFLPLDFEIPPALIGVMDSNGHVEAIFGRAVNLTLMDTVTPITRPEDVRIANNNEKAALELMLATGVSRPGYYNRSVVNNSYSSLRQAGFTNTGGGKIDINLPAYAQMLPWLDNNSDAKTLYVIIRTNVTVTSGGTYTVNDGVEVSYKNHFNETVEIKSGGETIEAHGPAFNYNMMIQSIQADNQLNHYLSWGKNNTVKAKVNVFNYGDDIALSSMVLVKVPPKVAVDSTLLPLSAYTSGQMVYWSTGDIAPGSEKSFIITLYTTPPTQSLLKDRGPPDPWLMLEYSQVKFVHGFLQKPVTVPASQPLYGQLFESDMKLTRVHYSHPFAATNHPHTVYAEVSSDWPFTDDIFDINVNFSIDGVYAGTGTITTLEAGELLSCGITHTFTSEGTYTVFAEIVGPGMNEFYSDNNNFTAELVVVNAVTVSSKPDFGTGKDTFIAGGDAELSFGDQYNLKVGRVSSAGGAGSGIGITRTTLSFDTSGIPANALILDAELELYMYKSVGGNLPVSAYKLQAGWQESISWNSAPANDSTPIATISVDGNTGYKIWNLTTAFTGWLVSPESNFGMVLASDQESWYWSKEFYSSDTENGLRPKLVIHYAMLKNTPDVSTTEVNIADYQDKEIRLAWTPVPYSLYYEVYRSDSSTGPFSKLGDTWSFAADGGNGSLNNFFYDDVDGGYPDAPTVIATDRGAQPGTIRVYWSAPSDPSPSSSYFYRVKAIGIEGKSSSLTEPLPGQLTPTISKYMIYNATTSSGPWTAMLGETSSMEYLHTNLGQGKYMYYRIRSESSEGYQSGLSKIVWGRSNRAPSVSGPYISPQTAYTSDYLYAEYTFSDLDGDTESGSQIRWYRDSVLFTWYNDKTYIYPVSTKKGEVWYFTIIPKDGIEFGSPLSSGMVTIQNSVPMLTSAIVQPTGPSTTDPLRSSYNFYDADADTETGTQIHWYKNGVHLAQYDGSTSIPSSATSKGEVWNASIRSSDGTVYCAWVKPFSVTIKNTLPVASGVSISPVAPKTGDQLTAVYSYSDADSDTETGTRIYWYKNNQLQTAYNDKTVVPGSATLKNEQWYFAVIPDDGEQAGVKVSAPVVKIDNTPPSVVDMKMYPDSPQTEDTLSGWYTFFDDDSDGEAGTVIKWYRNNIVVSELEDKLQVPSSQTSRGEEWQFTITPFDGFSYGLTYYSESVFILNTGPEVSTAAIEPVRPGITDDLTLTYDFVDPDDDAINDLIVNWYKNGDLIGTIANQLTVPSGQTSPGETWYAEIQLDDGFDLGEMFTTESVTINNLPDVKNSFITPGSPLTTDILTANYEWSDPDTGDTESDSLITWYRDGTSVSVLAGAKSVPSTMTAKGETWFFAITPSDGLDLGEMLPAPPVTIGNSAPTASKPIISPSEPGKNDDLQAQYDFNDADGDTESGTTISWFMNNEQVSELDNEFTVPASMVLPGDIWYYRLRPSDGESLGNEVTSESVVIFQVSLSVSDAYITPSQPTIESKLEARMIMTQDDPGSDVIFRYRWFRNDKLVEELNGESTVSPEYTSKSDIWYFTVQLDDEGSLSEIFISSSVTIHNTAPEITDVILSPKPALSTEPLVLTYEFTDVDGDRESGTEIRWYRNDEPEIALNNMRSVPTKHLAGGDEWYCIIAPSDGDSLGAKIPSGFVTVNFRPVAKSVYLSPDSPTDEVPLTLSYDYSDADGDLEMDSVIMWYRNGRHLTEFDGMTTIESGFTNAKEEWYVVVTVKDGREFGVEVKSNAVFISDSTLSGSDSDTSVRKSGSVLSSPIAWIFLIILIVILIAAMFVLRRSKRLRAVSKSTLEPILTIEDAEAFSTIREPRAGIGETGEVSWVRYGEDLSDLEVPLYAGLNNILAMEYAAPCNECDGEMEGDLEKCANCYKEILH